MLGVQVVQWREIQDIEENPIQSIEKKADNDQGPSLCARSCLVNQGIWVECMQIKQVAQRYALKIKAYDSVS